MHLQQPSSQGPSIAPTEKNLPTEANMSSSLPFNKSLALKQLGAGGSQYITTQTLAQQIAYLFSDKIFTYSPETFDLDIALQQWNSEKHGNFFGFVPSVQAMQTRLGAGSIALGYVFSPDFDLARRHVPQSIIASSGSLVAMREALNQLSLLHELANPFVAHVAAAEYVGNQGLTADYVRALETADELGFGLVASSTSQDAQHMALFATILAKVLPTIHVYDGVASRDTVITNKLVEQTKLKQVYDHVLKHLSATETKHSDAEGKALRALKVFNAALKTKYEPFEYRGHSQAESVIVTFGSQEGSITAEIVEKLAKNGVSVGHVNVRLYRPFIEEEFLRVLPQTTRYVHVYGQVDDEVQTVDNGFHSRLYQDVVAALAFSAAAGQVAVTEIKYRKDQLFNYTRAVDLLASVTGLELAQFLNPNPSLTQISIWTLDSSPIGKDSVSLASFASKIPNNRVHVHNTHDNLVQGGVSRTDITISSSPKDESASPFAANIAYISSDKILGEFDILETVRDQGTIILSLAGVKDEDVEKKIPESVRNALVNKQIRLLILDAQASPTVASNAALETSLVHLAVARELFGQTAEGQAQVVRYTGLIDSEVETKLLEDIESTVRPFALPEEWSVISEDAKKISLRSNLAENSFAPFEHNEEDTSSKSNQWIIAAQGAVFKEAYDTKISLRPDAGVKTSVVTVKEHRRLTPMSYDRNVFHIEFDLGDSGLTYAIGEALGIHAENDSQEVQEFVKWYGLNPDEVVQVPSRDDPSILENRTVYQALMQNVDLFGRPPKRFYEALAEFATDENDKKNLLIMSLPEGATEFKRRAEVDTITFADILAEFPSAHPQFHDLIRIVSPLKRREYSIASAQHVTPTSVALLIVTVNWTDPRGRDRFGLATRYLNSLKTGAPVTVSVKPSVMKLPTTSTAPIIMAGLGTGLAPFRAFVQERAYQKQVLKQPIGSVLLYLGSRHQREEYLYGEEWEAYQAAGIITLIGKAFSRDQPQKIYIQDRMRQTMDDIRQAYIRDDGSFYLCGPTWPVPDVTEVLQEAVEVEAKAQGAKKVDGRREIETLKDAGRFVLEVY